MFIKLNVSDQELVFGYSQNQMTGLDRSHKPDRTHSHVFCV